LRGVSLSLLDSGRTKPGARGCYEVVGASTNPHGGSDAKGAGELVVNNKGNVLLAGGWVFWPRLGILGERHTGAIDTCRCRLASREGLLQQREALERSRGEMRCARRHDRCEEARPLRREMTKVQRAKREDVECECRQQRWSECLHQFHGSPEVMQ
jgi:hypothetical protein